MSGNFLRVEEDEFRDESGQQVPYMTVVVDDGESTQRVSVPREARIEARKILGAVEYGTRVELEVRVGLRRASEYAPAKVTYRLVAVKSPAGV